ncbi:hypothetical protein SAMN05421835_10494 [Amycolatopsis sacchari]|uniref:Pyrroline-5-carboxylate reductase catalytic N-terminal domain-containing protein n=1 Tax=Amycolatopsis sacchari TaxID=115433 RepID=A0A1I3PYZ1_9PSEU|nr:NAD(P)-binding domain-containing protein [Amycolatopsis sacchari]SFJ26431.1 hypothetical protein SAMN05421835_10494 [Amycolatopsis sacchari]
MLVAVLGSGLVGRTLATRFAELRHNVILGTRDPQAARVRRWATAAGPYGSVAAYRAAVEDSTVVVNATAGTVSLDVLREAGAQALAGKVLLDVANPVVEPGEDPPTLRPVGDGSLAEQIQREFPLTRVVKTLNTVSPAVMVRPDRLGGGHVTFLAGNDGGAKRLATGFLREMGWPQDAIIDLGDITGARSLEMLVPLRYRLGRTFGHTNFNFAIGTR